MNANTSQQNRGFGPLFTLATGAPVPENSLYDSATVTVNILNKLGDDEYAIANKIASAASAYAARAGLNVLEKYGSLCHASLVGAKIYVAINEIAKMNPPPSCDVLKEFRELYDSLKGNKYWPWNLFVAAIIVKRQMMVATLAATCGAENKAP